MQQNKDLKEFDVLYPETIDIEIGTETYTIKRLTLRQFAKVIKEISSVIDTIRDNEDLVDNVESRIGDIIAICFDQVINICAVAIDVESDYILDNFDILSLSRLVKAISELNDLKEIVKNFQTVWTELRPKTDSSEEVETTEETTKS